MKVRVGSIYVYTREDSLWEIVDAKHGLKSGTKVRVVNTHAGCPPANTMGHAYVEQLDGQFVGLVATAALSRPS